MAPSTVLLVVAGYVTTPSGGFSGGGWAGSASLPPAGNMLEFSSGPTVASAGVSACSVEVVSSATEAPPEVSSGDFAPAPSPVSPPHAATNRSAASKSTARVAVRTMRLFLGVSTGPPCRRARRREYDGEYITGRRRGR